MKKLNALAREAKINENASITCQHSAVINAPIRRVWEKLIQLSDWPSWNSAITHMELKGEINENTSFNWRINGSKAKSQIQYINPPTSLAWTGISRNIKRIYVWELTPDDDQTIVKLSTSHQGVLIILESNQKVFKELKAWIEKLKGEMEK